MLNDNKKARRAGKAALWAVRIIQLLLALGLASSLVTFFSYLGRFDPSSLYNGMASMASITGLIVLLFPVAGLLKSVGNDRTPFEQRNITRLMRTSVILLVMAAVQLLCDILTPTAISMIGGAAGSDATGMQPYVTQVGWHGTFNISTAVLFVFALVMYSLALVFRYGVALQQQSDETL